MNIDISLTDIRAFVIIAEQGNFTRAAEVLSCSRSQLSKQLNQLEAFLGVSLIIRTTRSQRLTEQGIVFLKQCQESFKQIDLSVATIVDQAQQLQGHININCVGGVIGEEWVVKLINDFIKLHPEITIELGFSSQRVDLIDDSFDVVFRMGELPDSGLVARKLVSIKNCILASAQYLDQHKRIVHPNELTKHSCITGSISQWRFQHVDQPSNKVEVTIKGGFRCKSGRAMKTSALSGLGIVRLPYLYCPEEIKSGQLLQVFSQWEIPDTPIYLLYHKDPHQVLRLNKFIQFTVAHFKDYLPEL